MAFHREADGDLNYFFDTYELPVLIVGGLLSLFLLLVAFCSLARWAEVRFRMSAKAGAGMIAVAVFSAGISLFALMFYVPDYLNDGRIRNIYVVDKYNDTRLVVWFIRQDTPAGMTEVYSHRLKSFDLHTGKQCGRLTLSRRYPFDDYHIYGPFNEFAWGYTGQKGMTFLDVFEPEVVADQQAILERNPVLGDRVRLWTGRNATRFDSVTFGLYVYTAGGDIYRIDPDLKATPIGAIDRNLPHVKETCAVCRQESRFIDLSKARSGWVYDGASKDNLRFDDQSGQTLNTIDVHALFGDDTYLYAAVRVGDEVWLFATMKRFFLSAVRTDSGTGEILGKIDYF